MSDIIKITDGDGFYLCNGSIIPKGIYPVMELRDGKIRLGTFSDPLVQGDFSEWRDGDDNPFASKQALKDYLELCVKVPGGGDGDGVTIPDDSIVEAKLAPAVRTKINPVINSKNYATGDGVSDDSAGLNAWLAAGNNLYLDAGTYIIGSRILSTSIRNGLKITAHPNAKIVPIAAFNQAHAYLRIENVTNRLHIDGLTIEGNAEIATPEITTYGINMSSIDIRDCENVVVKNCLLTKVVDAGIDIRDCINVTVLKNNIPKTTNFAIKIYNCDDVTIIRNKVSGNGFAQHDAGSIGMVPGVMATMCDRVFIYKNYLNDFKNTGTKTEGCDYVTYSHNTVTNVGKDGIKVQEFDTESKPSIKYVKIVNNTVQYLHPWSDEGSSLITCWNAEEFEISGNKLRGGLRGDADGGQEHGIMINASNSFRTKKGIIDKNIIHSVGRSGIWGQFSDNISVTNNKIYDYGLDLENIHGIWFESSPTGISIKNNKVILTARPASGFGYGINVGNSATDIEIEGNTVTYSRDSAIRLHLGNSKTASISNNKTRHSGDAGILLAGSGTQDIVKIDDNILFSTGGQGVYFLTNGMTINQVSFVSNRHTPNSFHGPFNIDGSGSIVRFINSGNSTTSGNQGVYGFRPTIEQEGTHTFRGNGSPEGVITANMGSIYLRYDGGTSTMLYIKASGNETNTGWIAK